LLRDGKIFGWLIGAPFAALVSLELIGNDALRVAATPPLDVVLIVGLVGAIWHAMRPRTRAERAASTRAAREALIRSSEGRRMAAEAGLSDEDLADDAGEDPPLIAAHPERPDIVQLLLRGLATAAGTLFAFILLNGLGLALARWARDRWEWTLPAALVIALLLFLAIRMMLREAKAAEKQSE